MKHLSNGTQDHWSDIVQFGTPNDDWFGGTAVDEQGNVYVAGTLTLIRKALWVMLYSQV
ncbi:MAG: SBBP repeat-containing protein [Deinococcales bacterium]